MATQVSDPIKSAPPHMGIPVPGDIQAAITRGRAEMLRDAPKRRLCQRFERGEQYWYEGSKGVLQQLGSGMHPAGGVAKPRHRIRNTFNFIRPIVQGKVSAATQRVPGYEITPTAGDPQRVSAARLAEKIARYGFDKWGLRRQTVLAASLAIGGGGEAFALPVFNPLRGPYVPNVQEDGTVEYIGQGEIEVRILSGNEVYWEPGVDFYDSRWWAIQQARAISEIEALPGFYGEVQPDAASDPASPDDRQIADSRLALLTEVFERPSPKHPEGRRFIIVNGRVACDFTKLGRDTVWDTYPLRGRDGKVIDEPILHRLRWTVDTAGGRDLGLTWQLIDAQRTINDCWNKLLEWKNRALNPRAMAPRGSDMKPRTDDPGGIDHYNLVGNADTVPKIEDVPTAFAGPLFQMLEKMQVDIRELGFDTYLAADANVAARTVTAVIQEYGAKWQSFLAELAEWHSRVMRHCLLLVSVHYSEQRKIVIRGPYGAEYIPDFDGAQLLDEVDVRVAPGSLEYQSREAVTQQVMQFAAQGWIEPQAAMLAIRQGSTDQLLASIELDAAKVERIIGRLRDGSVMDMKPRLDFVDGQHKEVPGWMPADEIDNIPVWRQRLGDWMKTQEYETLPDQYKEPAQLILAGLNDLQRRAAEREVARQNAMAEAQGRKNAARPVPAKQMPSQPSPQTRR